MQGGECSVLCIDCAYLRMSKNANFFPHANAIQMKLGLLSMAHVFLNQDYQTQSGPRNVKKCKFFFNIE